LDIISRDSDGYPKTILSFCSLEDIELRMAYKKSSADIVRLADAYDDIWMISANGDWHTVFFYTVEQLHACSTNGVTDAIRNDVFLLLKKHDRYNYFSQHALSFLVFDTKEVLDSEFGGNMYYYYK
jgi:hypothetical protein